MRPPHRVIEYSDLAERNFYRNTRTGESCWSMPAQVKFYIPPRLEDKVGLPGGLWEQLPTVTVTPVLSMLGSC